jgi:hypothetical protein
MMQKLPFIILLLIAPAAYSQKHITEKKSVTTSHHKYPTILWAKNGHHSNYTICSTDAIENGQDGQILMAGTAFTNKEKLKGFFVENITKEGKTIWHKFYPSTAIVNIVSIKKLISTNEFILAGNKQIIDENNHCSIWGYIVGLNVNGTLQWQSDVMKDSTIGLSKKNSRLTNVITTNDKSIVAVGESVAANSNADTSFTTSWVNTLNEAGKIISVNAYRHPSTHLTFTEVVNTIDGHLMVLANKDSIFQQPSVGYSNYSTSAVYKINKTNGAVIFTKNYPSQPSSQYGQGLASIVAHGKDFVLVGSTTPNNIADKKNFSNSVGWVLKIDEGGNILWEKILETTTATQLKKIKLNSKGKYVVIGNLRQFNHTPIYNNVLFQIDNNAALLSSTVVPANTLYKESLKDILPTQHGGYFSIGDFYSATLNNTQYKQIDLPINAIKIGNTPIY